MNRTFQFPRLGDGMKTRLSPGVSMTAAIAMVLVWAAMGVCFLLRGVGLFPYISPPSGGNRYIPSPFLTCDNQPLFGV